jgi:TonB-dependent starch-binding outer membrane protein SusC
MKFLRKLFMLISKYTLRLFIIQVICMNLGFAASTNSQSLDKVKVSLSLDDASLTTVFKALEEKTRFVFAYSAQLGSVDKSFDLHYKNVSLRQVLEDLSAQASIEFKRINKTISVTTKEARIVKAVQVAIPIRGTIKDDAGDPLPGVNILEKGTANGTSSDANGEFTMQVQDENSVLVFSFIGYTSQEVTVGSQTSLSIQLIQDVTTMQEIVVIGYGEQEKKDLTGAVSIVDSKAVQQRQATTIAEAMQGLATGVNIRGGGQPGSEAQVQIRGLKSFNGANPLYVIDGLVSTANRDFNPNDIESIQILKDASAAAIYGSRAANGVIIITTKKGKEGPMKVEFSGKTGVQTIPRYDLAGTEEFSRLNYMAYDNAGKTRQNLDLSVDTDWQDETFQTGSIQDYNLSFSGGGKNGSYLVSGNYFSNKGTVISTAFERLSFRVNTQASKGIFSIGENIAISNAKADEMSGNPILDVVRLLPTIPVYDASHPGGYGYGDEAKARTFGTNPIAIADLEDRTNENFRVRGNVWSELKLRPYLKYRINLGYETSSDNYRYLRKVGNWTLNQPADPSIANENRARSYMALVENTLTFDKEFGKHSLNILAGQTFQKDNYGQIWGTKRNLISNSSGAYYSVLDAGVTDPQAGGYANTTVLLSYLGRLTYDYDDKYLFSAVVRRDGSSRLSKANRWNSYPSISAAWRISQENFFKVSWISDLKIRANYGTLGSSNIGPYDYQPVVNTFSSVAFGNDQHTETGATQVKLVNTDLKWETVTQKNFGIDGAFLNDKISVTAEYYISDTKDVLTQMPIAMTTGNDGGNPVVNAASLQNKGFEFSVTYRESARPLNYFVTANLTTINNKVKDLGYGRTDIYVGNTRTEIGQPIGMWYVLETDGLFQNLEEVQNYRNSTGTVIQPDAKPGDIRFKDTDDNGTINNEDKVVVGSPWPDIELGLNLGASYKGIEFTMTWFGSYGAKIFNGPRSVMDRFDDNSNYRAGIQPWTEENPNTDVPRALYASTLNSRGDIDRWLESGSFTRLKFVSIAYTLPTALISKIGIESAKVSISGQNLLTFTKYKGLDPEFNGPTIYEKGYDFGVFPNVRTVSLGLQFTF